MARQQYFWIVCLLSLAAMKNNVLLLFLASPLNDENGKVILTQKLLK